MSNDYSTDPVRDNELGIAEIDMIIQGINNPDTVYVAAAGIAERAASADDPIRELRNSITRVALITTEIVKTMDPKSRRLIVKGLQEGQVAMSVDNALNRAPEVRD